MINWLRKIARENKKKEMPISKTAVLYRGTGCSSSFMKKASKILVKYGGFTKKKISNRCWIQTGKWKSGHFHTKKSIAYTHVHHYNLRKGKFDLVAGHSAGGFPAVLTNGKVRIGFNPFFTQYPFLDIIFHAKDDWLVIKDKPEVIKARKLILYKGKHGTFPTKEFTEWVKERYDYKSPKSISRVKRK